MRYTASQAPSRGPRPRHSLQTTVADTRTTVVGTLAAAVLIPALALAALSPLAAAGVAAIAFTAWSALRALRRHFRDRRRRGRSRRVCVPKTGVCVDV